MSCYFGPMTSTNHQKISNIFILFVAKRLGLYTAIYHAVDRPHKFYPCKQTGKETVDPSKYTIVQSGSALSTGAVQFHVSSVKK